MTVEEAIKILSDVGDINRCCAEDAEALDMAIKALEQQPCEDAVSRKDVHDMLENLPVTVENKWYNWLQKACLRLAELPSVTPKAEQKAVLGKIRAEIWEEAEWAYSNFDEYKEIVLEAEPDELPDDEFRFGLHRAVEIIDKYKAESEG